MGNDKRDRQKPEADLVREVDRLRALLKQAGIDAEQSFRETKASERRHVRDVAEGLRPVISPLDLLISFWLGPPSASSGVLAGSTRPSGRVELR